MRNFNQEHKIFIKSNNNTKKIYQRYTNSLIVLIFFIIIYNLIVKNYTYIICLIESLLVTLCASIIFKYFFNLINKRQNIYQVIREDNIISIALLLGLFSVNVNIFIIMIATFITILIKQIIKNINLSSSLYGILILTIYQIIHNNLSILLITNKLSTDINQNSFKIIDYLLGVNQNHLSPLLCLFIFLYLFYKKSIKYNIILPYLATITLILLSYGLLNNYGIANIFLNLINGNLLFLSIYALTDYPITPSSIEGQITYGIITGIITSILKLIIPDLAVILSLIISPFVLTKFIDKISFKLKYNQKFYYTYLIILFCLILTTIIISSIIL